MERIPKKHVLIIFFLIFLCLFSLTESINAFEVPPDMKMSATPNPVGSGARAIGVGGAFISIADDATAASWNPGGLLQLKKPEISIVGSFFSGSIDYKTSRVEGDIEDESPEVNHLNYFSVVIPRIIFGRNFVFSINYQHLYEFSQDLFYEWSRGSDPNYRTNIFHSDHKYQKGSLNTLSPALAIEITPSFSFGFTCNFWENNFLNNGWENITFQDEKGIEFGREKLRHSQFYEKYDFSGFNIHLGFLFRSKYYNLRSSERRFRIGGILKTPFKADIRHEKRIIICEKYPDDPVNNIYIEEPPDITNLSLKMPLSYGLGMSIDFTDIFSISLDVYRTHWEQYILTSPSGNELSPINNKLKEAANIKSTTQIRSGVEYIIEKPRRKIPLRFGAFYDPEPASGEPDDFYGVSFGTGIIYKESFSFDCAYQIRFGNKRDVESMKDKSISGDVIQHYFYASFIYYLFKQ